MSDQITSFRDVLDRWACRKHVAEYLTAAGKPTKAAAIRSWHRHNRIPPIYYKTLVECARRAGSPDITYRLLTELWKTRKAQTVAAKKTGPPAPASAG